MPKKITISISTEVEEYFADIAQSLDVPGNKKIDSSAVVNYSLKMLMMIEKIVGDPVTFIEDVSTGKKIIVPVVSD